MELVEAGVEDLDALIERWYGLASAMETYSPLNEIAYADASEVPETGFRELLADDGAACYLVVEDGETVGYLTVREGSHPSRRYARPLRVVDLAIDEGHRSEGLGSAVLDRVAAIARDRGCDHLTVSCEWGNDGARRFYRDAGFEPKRVTFARPLE